MPSRVGPRETSSRHDAMPGRVAAAPVSTPGRGISRRRLIVAAGMALALPNRAMADEHGALVIVRSAKGVVAVDPRTGETVAWNASLPATAAATQAAPTPGFVAAPSIVGGVGYWMVAPGEAGCIVRRDTGTASTWWWRGREGRPVALDLPASIEPAFASGTSARWFHGATIDASHLGSGTLRLLAVDLATGETVLDHALDRRLELAATRVSADGAVVAHVQSATTGVAFWLADLRSGTHQVEAAIETAAGRAAASAIDLAVATDGDAALVAAGLTWAWSGAPSPAAFTMWTARPDDIRTHTFPGEMLGIVPADAGSRP